MSDKQLKFLRLVAIVGSFPLMVVYVAVFWAVKRMKRRWLARFCMVVVMIVALDRLCTVNLALGAWCVAFFLLFLVADGKLNARSPEIKYDL